MFVADATLMNWLLRSKAAESKASGTIIALLLHKPTVDQFDGLCCEAEVSVILKGFLGSLDTVPESLFLC